MIKAVRVDHRLVHGQVAFTWTHFLAATRIIVIDDAAASDEFQKMALNMSKPAACKLNIFSVEKALEKMPKVEALNDEIFIVFGCVKDAARFIEGYPKVKEINFGGIAKKEGSKQFSEVVYLDDQEIAYAKRIMECGAQIIMQQLPSTKKEKLIL